MYIKSISKLKVLSLILVLIMVLSVSGCGSRSTKDEAQSSENQTKLDGDVNGGFNNNEEAKSSKGIEESGQTDDSLHGRMIIKSADISLETKTFDATIEEISRRTMYAGGYIESSNITGRRINTGGNEENRMATFRLRIPEAQFEQFILDFGNLGNVINERKNGQDITEQYFDTEARLKTLKIQEDRLLDILRKAEKVEDIIELERELSDVRYRIENLTGTLRKWDNLVSYSTISVVVYEVQEVIEAKPKPITFGQKIKNGFTDSIDALVEIAKGLTILIVSIIPFLIVIIPLVLLLLHFIRRSKIKDNNNEKNND